MSFAHPLLARKPARAAPSIPLIPGAPEIALMQGRVHEACGPARRTFAIWLAARTQGPVFWIAPGWAQEQLNSEGLCAWLNPARFLFITPKRAEDLLWSMEDILRAGASALCIADIPGLPTLTQVRRMHLAAETGGQTGAHLPLGLLLTPGNGGAAGVETRWHLSPRHEAGQTGWHLDRVRARTAPHKSWTVQHLTEVNELKVKTA